MPKFRKKPIVIEAEQFRPHEFPLPFKDRHACNWDEDGLGWYVVTVHGQKTSIIDSDWIIAEPDGRGFYPCKNDIFLNIYESVEEIT